MRMREYEIIKDTPEQVAKKLTELEKKHNVEVLSSHWQFYQYHNEEQLLCLVKLSSRVKITKSSIHKFKDLNPPTK